MADSDEIKKVQILIDDVNKSLANQKSFYEDIAGVTKENRKGLEDELGTIRDILSELGTRSDKDKEAVDDLKEQLSLLNKQNKAYTRQFQVRGRLYGQFKKEKADSINFVSTSAAIFNYSEKIARQYRDIARDVGLSARQSEALGVSFRRSLPNILTMGAEVEDLTSIYTTFMEETGRARFISDDDLGRMVAIQKTFKMLPSEVAVMAESFDLMGMSTETMNDILEETFQGANKMGLNSTKVIKTLQSNMKAMQSYSFVGGVRGMTEMAKQAVKMRIDVGDVLQMADKFYQPEAALEAAANLQMLGGDIAQAFGDPFETMYLARNKPEELAKRLQDMTENMLQFNEESGQYELPAEGRMQLKAAGEQLGINTDKMVEMARQASKIKDVKMNISGNAFDDEDVREGIAGMAKMNKNKEWVVDFRGEEIKLSDTSGLQKAVSDGMLELEDKSDTDLFKEIAINTQTMSEQQENMGQATRATVVQTVDYYAMIEAALKDELTAMNIAVQKNVEELFEGQLAITEKALEIERDAKGKITSTGKDLLKELSLEDILESNTVIVPTTDAGDVIVPGAGAIEVKDLSAMGAPGAGGSSVHSTFDPLNVYVHLKGEDYMKSIVTVPMAESIAQKVVQQINNNGGTMTGKEAGDNLAYNVTVSTG